MIPVAVSQRIAVDPRHGERRDALDQRWAGFLGACGLLPVPLPNAPDLAEALAARAGAAGLLLTGGEDWGTEPSRDATERRLVAWAATRGLPVLGICRGMQVLLALAGQMPGPVAGHVAVRHAVRLDGRMRDVNSYHALGARTVPAGLEAWGLAEDGVVEAVRDRRRRWLGLMWHPEREPEFDPADLALVAGHFGGEAR
ncbi:gamma-glutamyl-gamma-aminobutyrate hydrolase family protein [Paracraurococcus ruber]|uniref:Glutamine amidotransferase n=1 Tax=Paracraurococcus ruber TaxID=77675 RepID=A0ABS1CW19_9PROT|nr:gamma-glutamyl-gamma-aminobutyrate hydrolase family protein [Paracraurococcus ruber]MBK1658599.1 hypothetical protein [Paracraurococcus ruber]TDG28503.1 gamma-glutamyl-gamma-aminobutyrate hydrolase [Paracraurococcus ruber]